MGKNNDGLTSECTDLGTEHRKSTEESVHTNTINASEGKCKVGNWKACGCSSYEDSSR